MSDAKWIALYCVGTIVIYALLWLLIEMRVIEFNQAVNVGKEKEAESYFVFDPSNTSTRDGYVIMETVLSFKALQRNPDDPGKPYKSMKSLDAFDCQKRAVGTIQRSIYPDEFAKGAMILEVQEALPLDKVEFKPVLPGSKGEQRMTLACGHISRPKIWWAMFKASMVGGELDLH